MRLEKRERRALKELRRLKRLAMKRAEAVEGQPSIRGSMASAVPTAGTSKPGADLLRYERKADKPTYSIDREPRIRALTGRKIGGKVVSSLTTKRFANA
jgi:hypothetical protein